MREVSVRAIIVDNGKLLCVRLKHNGEVRDFWCLPGGRLNPHESINDGLRREMLEETGVEPDIGELLFVHQYSADGNETLEFFFRVTNVTEFRGIDLSKTTHGEAEIAELAFRNPATTHLLPEFLKTTDFTNTRAKFVDNL